jgi:SAM-dependent methyltransferase
MAEYDGWAAYYDIIHRGLPGEAEFYIGQAVRIGGVTLELGCGTGRLAIPMAMSGVNVVGLDKSRLMLEECWDKCEAVGETPGRLWLVQGDMERFALGRSFDFIAMAYRTFMHLLTPDAQRRCLANVREHMKPDGLFALNAWAPRPSAIAAHLKKSRGHSKIVAEYAVPGDDLRVRDECVSRYDEYAQLLIEEHELFVVDCRGAVVDTARLELVRAWTTVREMENLVRLSGFEIEALFGDFDCTPFTRHSTEMIWILRRGRSPSC